MTHASIPPVICGRAKTMRKTMTDAELKLWNASRAHRLMDLGFRWQMPVAGYIADFACPAAKLIVEVDGSQHGAEAEAKHDELRTGRLEEAGWTVVRFWDGDVLNDIDGACQHVVEIGQQRAATP